MAIRVVIADGQETVRTGFRMIPESRPDIEVVAHVVDGEAALAAVAAHRPHALLPDIRMPKPDGLEVTRRPAVRDGPRIVIVTTFDLDEYVHAALHAGASGFLLKDASPAMLVEAVRAAAVADSLVRTVPAGPEIRIADDGGRPARASPATPAVAATASPAWPNAPKPWAAPPPPAPPPKEAGRSQPSSRSERPTPDTHPSHGPARPRTTHERHVFSGTMNNSAPDEAAATGAIDENVTAELARLRDSIDNIDAAVVHMLAERFKCTQQVGHLKAKHQLPPADPTREASQIARLRELAENAKLDPAFAEKLLNFIIAEVIRHHETIAAGEE